jgi:hypothetical protein
VLLARLQKASRFARLMQAINTTSLGRVGSGTFFLSFPNTHQLHSNCTRRSSPFCATLNCLAFFLLAPCQIYPILVIVAPCWIDPLSFSLSYVEPHCWRRSMTIGTPHPPARPAFGCNPSKICAEKPCIHSILFEHSMQVPDYLKHLWNSTELPGFISEKRKTNAC